MSNVGGGELLRATMAANCLSSAPFFYCLQITSLAGGGPSPFTNSGMLQTKSDSYFLMTSIFAQISNDGTSAPEFVDVFDASNMKPIVDNPSVWSGAGAVLSANANSVFAGLLNDTLTSCMTLPEYVLWMPNSLIGVRWMGENHDGDLKAYRYLTLAGIEYKMEGS